MLTHTHTYVHTYAYIHIQHDDGLSPQIRHLHPECQTAPRHPKIHPEHPIIIAYLGYCLCVAD